MYVPRAFHPSTVWPLRPAIILAQISRDDPRHHLHCTKSGRYHPTREFRVNLHYNVRRYIYIYIYISPEWFCFTATDWTPCSTPPASLPSHSSNGHPVVHTACRLLSHASPQARKPRVPNRLNPTTADLLYNYNNIL